MYDASGLEVKDTLQSFYDSHNGRLPTTPIPSIDEEEKPFKDVLREYIEKLEKEPIVIMQEAKVEHIKIDIKLEKEGTKCMIV